MVHLRPPPRQRRRIFGSSTPKISVSRIFVGLIGLLSLTWLLFYQRLLWSTMSSTSQQQPVGQQYVRYNKRGKEVMHRIDRVRLDDLTDLTDDYLLTLKQRHGDNDPSSLSAMQAGKQVLLDELHRSGVRDLDEATIQLLPSWQEVAELYYPHTTTALSNQTRESGATYCQPIIYGLDKCRAFAERHATNESFLATAGFYNTGTNALTYTLRANLYMPGNAMFHGILAQVPWHKHWFISQRQSNSIPHLSNINLDRVLPIVTIRDPLSWAQSMCTQPYDVEWTATDKHKAPPKCPSLLGSASVRITKQTGKTIYANLFDLWNAWYGAYLNAAQDDGLEFVMIRHEDLIYCPRQVVLALQACSGAAWTTSEDKSFVYVMDQAKWEHARVLGKAQSNRVSAMIKHGHARGRRIRHLSTNDVSQMHLNQTLMRIFGYRLPDPSILSRD